MTTLNGDIKKAPFGRTADGQSVDIFTLRNGLGAELSLTNYGGIVTSFKVPDKKGQLADVVLGHDNLEGYLKASPYFGCLVGRYGNRINHGKFILDGVVQQVTTNTPPHMLHGGAKGFDKVVWTAKSQMTPEGPAVELEYLSPDGEEGFPGNLRVKALQTLTRDNALRIDFTATTDQITAVNLTHHSYFNLAGKGDVLNHVAEIKAEKFTPINSTLIPTGELKPVSGTPFDFRKPTRVGDRINADDEQIKFGGGYDHNWVPDKAPGKLDVVLRMSEPTSGRVLEVLSDLPGVQFYTGNFLDGTITGKGGWVYQKRNGFCVEPQFFPDSVNHTNFPSSVLKPGETHRSTIIYRFSAA